MNGPYLASEDSALLREAARKFSGGRALEIGAGNGGALLALGRRFSSAAGTDIQRPSMSDWRLGADFVIADLASCFRDSTFDLVVFNPPYLEGEGSGDLTVDGGEGLEVPMRFLEDALRVVKRTGRVLFLLNDSAELGAFEAECSKRGFGVRKVIGERVFFEEIAVYEAVQEEQVRGGDAGRADRSPVG